MVMSEKNQGLWQRRREVEVAILLLNNDKNKLLSKMYYVIFSV